MKPLLAQIAKSACGHAHIVWLPRDQGLFPDVIYNSNLKAFHTQERSERLYSRVERKCYNMCYFCRCSPAASWAAMKDVMYKNVAFSAEFVLAFWACISPIGAHTVSGCGR